MELEIAAATADRWADLETLFGERGAYSGCWCMWWRVTASTFDREAGAGNRRALAGIVRRGDVPGLLAYRAGRPVGWVAIAPLGDYGRILRSPTLKPEPGEPIEGTWAVTCFYVDRDARGDGLSAALLEAAVEHAAARGARTVEGYPVVTISGQHRRPVDVFTGTLDLFLRAGFTEVRRRSPTRAVVRRTVG